MDNLILDLIDPEKFSSDYQNYKLLTQTLLEKRLKKYKALTRLKSHHLINLLLEAETLFSALEKYKKKIIEDAFNLSEQTFEDFLLNNGYVIDSGGLNRLVKDVREMKTTKGRPPDQPLPILDENAYRREYDEMTKEIRKKLAVYTILRGRHEQARIGHFANIDAALERCTKPFIEKIGNGYSSELQALSKEIFEEILWIINERRGPKSKTRHDLALVRVMENAIKNILPRILEILELPKQANLSELRSRYRHKNRAWKFNSFCELCKKERWFTHNHVSCPNNTKDSCYMQQRRISG